MERTVKEILDALRTGETLDPKELDRILRTNSARLHDGRTRIAKKNILPFYLSMKQKDPIRWSTWDIDPDLERRFVECVRMKPRRSASGVATITVITKPWPCSGSCVCCPNDIRMPKSYLHDEPACQRAERSFFDPYLQAAARLEVLELMGHNTDKMEMIVLGGNWLDYPASYRRWFATELYRALNDDAETRRSRVRALRKLYEDAGIPSDAERIERSTHKLQDAVNRGEISYNEAVTSYYRKDSAWAGLEESQTASDSDLKSLQLANESSPHRMVGLVFEMRPDSITPTALAELRGLGCTKVQIGIQSLRADVLDGMGRKCNADRARESVRLVRLFGFKIHEHIMANLPGSTPESDKREFELLVADAALIPDEIKLYPCSLVDGTALMDLWHDGSWHPYSEHELIDLLAYDTSIIPPYVRISRMVRDIGAQDIVAGNKKANLRQEVERSLLDSGQAVKEIRMREIATDAARIDELHIDDVPYETDVSREHFLQWVDNDYRIYGFLRLSLPNPEALSLLEPEAPIGSRQAMIREVHVYGFAETIGSQGSSAQHQGLGRRLVERACSIAREAGYDRINVISAVGTRGYYRALGFEDGLLYQSKPL